MTLLALLFVVLLPQGAATPPLEAGLSAQNLEKLRKIALSASKAASGARAEATTIVQYAAETPSRAAIRSFSPGTPQGR